MAQPIRKKISNELIYQGPLIGMKETKQKEADGTLKKPAAGENKAAAGAARR